MQLSAVRIAGLILALMLAAAAGPAHAQSAPAANGPAAPDTQAILASVVGIRVKALPDARSNATLTRERTGSGVVIDAAGHVLTIGYIVMEADSIELTTRDHRTVPAVVIGFDQASGLAVLQAQTALGVAPLPLGQSEGVSERERVVVVRGGESDPAHLAVVVSRRRFAASWEYMIDAAIFTAPPVEHWAGAALVDRQGMLIGIGSLTVRDAGGGGEPFPGTMFVPIEAFQVIAGDLIRYGRRAGPARPWFGMVLEEMFGHLVVVRVPEDGPAALAGVQAGDVLVAVSGQGVGTLEEAYRRMWAPGPAGTEVGFTLLQGSELQQVRIRSASRSDYFRVKPGT